MLGPIPGTDLVSCARNQVGITLSYDPSYRALRYPSGDVPRSTGVCTDVVIRALRDCYRLDVQRQVHEDIMGHRSAYLSRWGKKRPDSNIDHRRVPNLAIYFRRHGWSVPPSRPMVPGEIVTCVLRSGRTHIMVVSDRKGPSGRYLVIHNVGAGVREEDYLPYVHVTGVFRYRTVR